MQNTLLFPQSLIQNNFQFYTEKNHSGFFGSFLSKKIMKLCENDGDLRRTTFLKLILQEFQNLFFSIITCEVFHSLLQEVNSI